MMKSMKKWLRMIGILGLLAVIAMQLANPSHQNPPVLPGHDLMATNAPPPSVALLLRNSCYDCHSFETKWPWYGQVAPVSWLLARDINAARSNLNFSDWPHDDASRARKRWRHIAEAVENGEMPLPSYTRMHPEARLDERQRDELVKWAKEQADSTKQDSPP
jgi:Haem-binding domain